MEIVRDLHADYRSDMDYESVDGADTSSAKSDEQPMANTLPHDASDGTEMSDQTTGQDEWQDSGQDDEAGRSVDGPSPSQQPTSSGVQLVGDTVPCGVDDNSEITEQSPESTDPSPPLQEPSRDVEETGGVDREDGRGEAMEDKSVEGGEDELHDEDGHLPESGAGTDSTGEEIYGGEPKGAGRGSEEHGGGGTNSGGTGEDEREARYHDSQQNLWSGSSSDDVYGGEPETGGKPNDGDIAGTDSNSAGNTPDGTDNYDEDRGDDEGDGDDEDDIDDKNINFG